MDFSLECWQPLVGERFTLEAPGTPGFPVVLSACEAGIARAGRTPFSLLFHAPAGEAVEQQICSLRHAERGNIDLFVVPLGPDREGMRYEAVIS